MKKYSETNVEFEAAKVHEPTASYSTISYRRDNAVLITADELKKRLHESLKTLF